MRYRHARHGLVAATLAGAAGCLPATYTAVPQLAGRVLDTTGRPVSGATVAVDVDGGDAGDRALTLDTDGQGVFSRPEETHWWLAPVLPLDFLPKTYVAVTSAGAERSPPKACGGAITNYHFLGLTNPTAPANFGDLVVATGASAQR